MRKSLFALAIVGIVSGPALAQTAPGQPVQTPKPQTVKKTVCQRVDDEETTGSRLGSAPKVCKTIEVPVRGGAASDERAPAPVPERGL